MKQSQKITRYLAHMGLFAAIGVILALLIHFPIFPSATFLKYDVADIPILIISFLYGPASGLVLTVMISVMQEFMSGESGIIGVIMHIVATGSMAVAAGLIYKRWGARFGGKAAALLGGTAAMVLAMVLFNLLLTPLFLGVPIEAVKPMILPIIVPFNLIKAGVNSLLAAILYNHLQKTKLFAEQTP